MPEVAVFIAHAPDDSRWAEGLAEGLAREGIQAFSPRDIGPGDVELREIEEAIGTASTAILVLSAAAVADPIVNDQYAALFHEATSRGLRLIPVLHGAASIHLPPLTGTRLWADFRGLSQAEHDAKVVALAWAIQDVVPDTELPAAGVRVPATEVLQAVRAASRPASPPPQPKFVVTYAGPDAEYGERLRGWLRQSGLPAWSIADLKWGSRFIDVMRQQLRHALAVIVIMSPAAEDSEDVEREILEGQRRGREFLPVLLRGDCNFLLASSWYFDARDGALPGGSYLRRLQRIYEAHLSGRPATPAEETRRTIRAPVGPGLDGIPRQLRMFLKEEEFVHADLLTTALVLAVARRLDSGWMDRADALELPISLLASIDEAWSGHTGGRQGFQQQLDLYRLRSERGADFLNLATAYGWKEGLGAGRRGGELGATHKYHEFVDRTAVPAGFFPTLRNPQVEAYPAWHDRWQSTVVAVHLRLRDWEKGKDRR